MFLLKKLLAGMLMPLSLTVVLLLLGLLMLWFSRRQKTGKALVTFGVVLLMAQVYGWGFNPALAALERRYPPQSSVEALADVRWIVVLGGGASADQALPQYARLSPGSLSRVVEGVRLYRQLPAAKLLLSGGQVFGYGMEADAMQDLAIQLGVNPADIVTDRESQDTESQAVIVRQRVGNAPVLLVTSASHMQRAVGLFRQAAVTVYPAPANYQVQDHSGLSPHDLFPDSRNAVNAYQLTHELLGIAWAKLRAQM